MSATPRPTGSAPAGPDRPRFAELPVQLRVAVVVVAVQGVALVVFGLFLAGKTVFGHPQSVVAGLLEALFAVLGGAIFLLGARGLAASRPVARTPVVVIEVLCLPVSYSLGFQAGLIGIGAPILVSALVVLYLLFTPPARAALDRQF